MSLQKLKDQLTETTTKPPSIMPPDVAAIVSKGKAGLRAIQQVQQKKRSVRICWCGRPGCDIGPFHEQTEFGTPDLNTGPFLSK